MYLSLSRAHQKTLTYLKRATCAMVNAGQWHSLSFHYYYILDTYAVPRTETGSRHFPGISRNIPIRYLIWPYRVASKIYISATCCRIDFKQSTFWEGHLPLCSKDTFMDKFLVRKVWNIIFYSLIRITFVQKERFLMFYCILRIFGEACKIFEKLSRNSA